jgi:hypothetical protein
MLRYKDVKDKGISRYSVTEHNRYEKLRACMLDLYSQAHSFHWTFTELLNRLSTEIYDDPAYKKLSIAHRAALSEVSRMSHDYIYHHLLVWRMGDENGPIPLDDKGQTPWTDALSELARSRKLYSGHFWKDAPDKPFGEYRCSN